MTGQPPIRVLSPRAHEIAATARMVLEAEGSEAVTMRRLAAELGIRAPSLYKHFASKQAVETVLIDAALHEVGILGHRAVAEAGDEGPVVALLRAYRSYGIAHPHLYRLVTNGHLHRDDLTPGLESWAGTPWFLATGEPYCAQALWAFAHGTVSLEIDQRFLDGSDLDRTWAAGGAAFSDPKDS